MATISILLAENDPDFCNILADFLTEAGYRVTTAGNPEQTIAKLQSDYFHLAILDMRLRDDLDNKDRTGLQIAKTVALALPKLILTKFPHHEDVVEVMKPRPEGLPAAVDYLDKKKRLPDILTAIEEAVAKHLQFNWELVIDSEAPTLSVAHLVHALDVTVTPAGLDQRKEEIIDLLRHLFHEYAQVTLHHILLAATDCLHLAVHAHTESGATAQFVLACGQVDAVKEMAARYEAALPRRVRQARLPQGEIAETVHFAAVAYQIVAPPLEESWPLAVYARHRTPAETLTAVAHLYTQTLPAWHENGHVTNQETTMTNFYQAWLAKRRQETTATAIQDQIETLCQQVVQAGMGQITYAPHMLTLPLAEGQTALLANPAVHWENDILLLEGGQRWGMTHGRIDLAAVMVTDSGQSWLLDFSQAGQAPLVHDFASLETAVWLRLSKITDVTAGCALFQTWLPQFPFPPAATIADQITDNQTAALLTLVGHIRQLAQQQTGCSVTSYLTALFFWAADELLDYEPTHFYRRERLAAYMRALLSTAVLYQHLTQAPLPDAAGLPDHARHSLWIDDANKVVWVEGKQIELTIQDYEILSYLYRHAGKLCDRRAIVEEALGEVYDEFDPEQSRLNSAISRLRQKIEPDARNVRYLLTVRGHGYKLNVSETR
jgi:DNA-binding response OmpR family regulator